MHRHITLFVALMVISIGVASAEVVSIYSLNLNPGEINKLQKMNITTLNIRGPICDDNACVMTVNGQYFGFNSYKVSYTMDNLNNYNYTLSSITLLEKNDKKMKEIIKYLKKRMKYNDMLEARRALR